MLRHTLVVIGVCAMSALIAYRAYVIPFSHDEASTWLNYRHLNVWSCLSNYFCWASANNHWLNTLLLQWSASIFGEQPWALRLPNILAGVAYLLCAALIVGKYVQNYGLQLAGFLFLSAHVYLLDFFSLARGYGLMAAGVIWGVYGMLRYIEKSETKWLVTSIVMLMLAVLSNFTALIPFAGIGIAWLVWILLSGKFNLILRHGVYWVGSVLVLYFLLRYPVKTVSGSGALEWGASGISEMGADLMRSLLYGVRYFGDATYLYALYALIALLGLIVLTSLFHSRKETKHPIWLMTLILVLNIIVIVLQMKLTGSQAPEGRKTIFLIPIIFAIVACGLGLIRNTGTASLIGIIISLALIGHLIRTLPMKSTREWYYDAYYPQMLSSVLPEGEKSDSIRLGSSWIFNPSLVYYQKTQALPISGLDYQKPLIIDSTMHYYFVEPVDTVGMIQNGFDLEKRIGPVLLFKNKRQ